MVLITLNELWNCLPKDVKDAKAFYGSHIHLDKYMEYKVIENSQTPKKIPALTEEIPEPQGLLAMRARNAWPGFASSWLDSIPFPSPNRETLSIITTWECSLAWLSPWQCLSIIWKGWSGPKLTAKSQVAWVIPGSTGAGIPLLSSSLVLAQPRTPWLLLGGFVEDSWKSNWEKPENLNSLWRICSSGQPTTICMLGEIPGTTLVQPEAAHGSPGQHFHGLCATSSQENAPTYPFPS